jgi:hypothetical protein
MVFSTLLEYEPISPSTGRRSPGIDESKYAAQPPVGRGQTRR